MTFYERIESLRKERGISQGNLEKELGFSNGSYSKWKNSMPTPDRLQKLAEYFGVSVNYLMTGENAPSADMARDEHERTLLTLCRNATKANPEDKEALVKNFESTIEMYLKAKGLK